MVREDLTEKVTLEQRAEGGVGGSHVGIRTKLSRQRARHVQRP